MKPLLLTALGSPLSDAPLGRRGDDVEVRAIPALPVPRALDLERPTVLALDRTLIASAGDGACSQLRALAGAHRHRRASASPARPSPGTAFRSTCSRASSPAARRREPRSSPSAAPSATPRRWPRCAARATPRSSATRELAELTRDRRRAHHRARPRQAAGAHPHAGAPRHRERRGIALPRGARRERRAGAAALRAFAEPSRCPPSRSRRSRCRSTRPASPATRPSTGEPLVIGDVYLLPDGAAYRQNRSFDDTFGYRTKSMLVLPMKTHRDEIIGVLQLINRKRDPDARLACADEVEREVRAVRRAVRRARDRARVAGGRRDRERPAVRGHRAAVRGVRHRRGHGDRIARPDDVGSLRPRRDDDGRRSPRRWIALGERTVSRRQLHARAAARAPLRRPAARLRQGRRARAGAGEGEEALSARPRAHPAPLRVPRSARGARVRARARRAAPGGRARGVRGRPRAARVRAADASRGARALPRRRSSRPTSRRSSPRAASMRSRRSDDAPSWTSTGTSARCSRTTSCSSS